jgi:capsular exopolysaccharide synthesis family protein
MGEGRTAVAVHLAQSLANAGRSVAVVDADLQHPGVAESLGLVGDVGLIDVLAGTVTAEQAMQSVDDGNIAVLAAGANSSGPTELVTSQSMGTLIDQLAGQYDVVLIDTPPLVGFADSSVLATVSDGVLLCVRSGHTQRHELQLSQRQLSLIGARLVGVVLTMVPHRAGSEEGLGHATDPAGTADRTPGTLLHRLGHRLGSRLGEATTPEARGTAGERGVGTMTRDREIVSTVSLDPQHGSPSDDAPPSVAAPGRPGRTQDVQAAPLSDPSAPEVPRPRPAANRSDPVDGTASSPEGTSER